MRSAILLLATLALAADQPAGKVARDGVTVEFDIQRVTPEPGTAAPMEGAEALVRFRVTDSAGAPMRGLAPAAWMDARSRPKSMDEGACKNMVQSYLQGSLRARPAVDLNSYFILALNEDPSITVIDPLLGYGASKLYTLVGLKSRGADWVMTRDKRLVFVSQPEANSVAVIDTVTWKIVADIATDPLPGRLALQEDGRYLWVVREGGVAAIDTGTLRVAASIATGRGARELALTPGDRYVLVANADEGDLTAIDVRELKAVGRIPAGKRPVSIDVSPLARVAYVADEAGGAITVVDTDRLETVATIRSEPGLGMVRFAPGARWAFAVNPRRDRVLVIDSASHRIAHTLEPGPKPDQVSFTAGHAYIRLRGSEMVKLASLAELGQGAAPSLAQFPGAKAEPLDAAGRVPAGSIVAARESGAALVASAHDRVIYYYMEGMAAPQESFRNYGHEPNAVLVVDKNLRETAPGVYSTTVRLPVAGAYDVPFLLSSPRLVHCFETTALADPERARQNEAVLRVEPLTEGPRITAGRAVTVRFRLTRGATAGKPVGNAPDVTVLAFLVPGMWQSRTVARSAGEGVYESEFTPPGEGVYYVSVAAPSLGLRFQDSTPVLLYATGGREESGNETSSR